ncbi:hypothetical protein [Promineifilum sp.]|uniref:hypothetical protein n=1 Tax=Promineifilum sp. TaxID=2664178 RepID=UPI0035B2C526
MRKLIMFVILALTVLLAACTASGTQGEPILESDGSADESPALNPVGDGAYPVPDSYPEPVAESDLPTGYPESGLVPPSGEVDLGSLTPEVNENTTPQVAPAPGRPGLTGSPQLGRLMEAVRLNLSTEMGLSLDQISIVSAEPMTWPNAALGCPQEGMAYAEVQVEGTIITLEAAGQQYTYHTGGTGNFVLCQGGEPIATGVVPQR